MGRKIGAAIAGLVLAFVAMMATSFVGGRFYPLPVDTGISDPIQRMAESFSYAPLGAQLFIALSWFVGGLVGAAVAKSISRDGRVAWTVGAIVTVITLANIFLLPMPAWLQIASVALPLIGTMIANHLIAGERAAGPSEGTADAEV
jgi:hypothetical protein